MEVVNMAGMTGEIVFVMLIIGIVCIGMICTRKIKENELKREELERKRLLEGMSQKEVQKAGGQELEKQEIGTKIKDENLDGFKRKLLQTEQELWEMKGKGRYEDFFHKVAMPLQVLLGFSEVSLDGFTEEHIRYYLWEVIAEPILRTVDQMKGTVVNGKLLLSGVEREFDKEKVRKNMESFGKEELKNYIQENERRLEAGTVVFQKVGVVQGLGSVVDELRKWEGTHIVDKTMVYELAQKVKKLLEENRIYPMFAADRRLASYPELKKRYIPMNKNSIKYPGLFIERDGVWEVFGSNIGMDDCGV